jgi:hypothetical protein
VLCPLPWKTESRIPSELKTEISLTGISEYKFTIPVEGFGKTLILASS